MNFLAELQRRKVIRVALAYAVVAWFIVQAADILLGNFEAPRWVFKTLASLLALGLPLVLFLAWAYDLTPEGIRKTGDADETGTPAPDIGRGFQRALLAGLVVMALAATWLTLRGGDGPASAQADSAQRAPGSATAPLPNLRLSIPMPDDLEVTGPIAISRDGRQIAFAAANASGEAHVYLRRLDSFELLRVEDSRDGRGPFFSPDGAAVGFFARNVIWRAATSGGPPTGLRAASGMIGADWMDDDTIVYSEGLGSAIQRMSAGGEALEPATALGDGNTYAHVWPQQIPGTDRILFTAWTGGDGGGAHIADLRSGTARALWDGHGGIRAPARWSASGHVLLENWDDGVSATRFDPASGQTLSQGSVRFLLGEVHHLGSATRSVFALSDDGTFAYVPAVQSDRKLVRIQADGSIAAILDQSVVDYARLGSNIAISADGRQALLGEGDIVVVDLQRKLARRLASDGNDFDATFSPDEREVYFRSNREGRWKVWKQPVDGSGAPELVVEHERNVDEFSLGAGGEMVFGVTDPATGGDVWIRESAGAQRALLQSSFNEGEAVLSPDRRFLAYVSDVSGSREVYVLPASGQGAPEQVSADGGVVPKWTPDGRALMFRKGRTILQVAIDNGRPVGEPAQRFIARNLVGGNTYAMAADGDDLLAVQLGDGSIPREIRVITGFFDEIERVTGTGAKP